MAQFGGRPPPDLGEFALVRTQGLPQATGEGEPQADVHVPRRGRTHGLGHREEERLIPERRVGLCGDAEFLDGLAPDGVEGMLAGLDMPSGRQPQAGSLSRTLGCLIALTCGFLCRRKRICALILTVAQQ